MSKDSLVVADDVSDTAVETYYNSNPSQFQRDEEVRVDYVILEPADFETSVDMSLVEAELERAKSELMRREAEVAHITHPRKR